MVTQKARKAQKFFLMECVLILLEEPCKQACRFLQSNSNPYSLCKMNKALMVNEVEYKLVYNYTHFNSNVFHQELSVKMCGRVEV